MEKLIKNIKKYFEAKEKGEILKKSPEGIYPNCWGRYEWEGQYYKLKKDNHFIPEKKMYDNFIRKIVEKHVDSMHKHKDQYICTTCSTII